MAKRTKKRRVSITLKLTGSTRLALDTIKKRVMAAVAPSGFILHLESVNYNVSEVEWLRVDVVPEEKRK